MIGTTCEVVSSGCSIFPTRPKLGSSYKSFRLGMLKHFHLINWKIPQGNIVSKVRVVTLTLSYVVVI